MFEQCMQHLPCQITAELSLNTVMRQLCLRNASDEFLRTLFQDCKPVKLAVVPWKTRLAQEVLLSVGVMNSTAGGICPAETRPLAKLQLCEEEVRSASVVH